ncbi:hypothetical protein COOONC_03477 [Cooperia oncophora]
MRSRNVVLYRVLNTMSNYLIGVVSFVVYAAMLLILAKKKKFSFTGSYEVKVTLQISFMMIGEILFFIYWEFFKLQGYGAWDHVIAETSVVVFFDILIAPFLILNKNIHSELKRIYFVYRGKKGTALTTAGQN